MLTDREIRGQVVSCHRLNLLSETVQRFAGELGGGRADEARRSAIACHLEVIADDLGVEAEGIMDFMCSAARAVGKPEPEVTP